MKKSENQNQKHLKLTTLGFTLIELLAVIVILSVIALITTPLILNVVESTKENSSKVSALGYVDAIEKQVAINMLDTSKTNIEDGVYEISTLKSTAYGVKVKGEEPTDDSWIKIEKERVVEYSLKIGEYVVNYSNSKTTITKGGEIDPKPEKVNEKGATKEEKKETDTHKGIVYLDPTNLTNKCNEENSISITETKTGCMKWYIFEETDNEYTMILDHNTTARIMWNDDNKNVAYESSNLYSVVNNLKNESGWKVNPRIITAEEINKITGKTDFNSSSTNSWYYFDSNNQTQTATSKGASKYAWLYDNLYGCEGYGCNINDNNTYIGVGTSENGVTYGYWTSTTVGSSGAHSTVWPVRRDGHLKNFTANYINCGIRPVITIPKIVIS